MEEAWVHSLTHEEVALHHDAAGFREELERHGPGTTRPIGTDAAIAYCRRLAGGHYENFSVISSLVPAGLRDDFASVYAFCRWADDLGDEIGDPEESARLLQWWKQQLHACFGGEPEHPVFEALDVTRRRHQLPIEPFEDLIEAFLLDQHCTRYETWNQLLDYCKLSADPVGRLVLMLLGEPRSGRIVECSDMICTALQLTNHFQDVSRDFSERNRIYIPGEFIEIPGFEDRLGRTISQGFAVDEQFMQQSRDLIRTCVERTWPLFIEGREILDHLQPHSRPVIRLFIDGGMHVLRSIQCWNYETILHRPRLTRSRKLMLVGRAWISSRFNGRRGTPARVEADPVDGSAA